MVIRDFLSLLDKDEIILIFSYYFDISKSQVLMNLEKEISNEDKDNIMGIIDKRKKKVPLQYAIGKWNFYGYDFLIEEGVLIPRPETELLVENLLKFDTKDKTLLDICTGSGIIGITGRLEGDFSKVLLSDISNEAINLSERNIRKFNLENVSVVKSDLFKNISEKFSFITANPPYIKRKDLKELSDEVKKEPILSLDGGEDGIYFYEKIIREGRNYLLDNGKLLLEIGYDQKERVNRLLEEFGYINILNIKDYNGFDRIVIGERGKYV